MGEKLYSNFTNAMAGHFGSSSPEKGFVHKAGDVYIERPTRVITVKNTSKREFLVAGYILDSSGQNREMVVLKNNIQEVIECPYSSFVSEYSIVKVYREGIAPELIYLDGVPDKITSGQQWIPKDSAKSDPFTYSAAGTYASDEIPTQIWEVQSVIENEVILNLVKQDTHESGYRNNSNTGQVLKLTKLELVTKYQLYSHGFHLSDAFYKFIQNETYVAPENRDKIYMMGRGGKGEYVQMDDMLGPPKAKKQVDLGNL